MELRAELKAELRSEGRSDICDVYLAGLGLKSELGLLGDEGFRKNGELKS